MVHCRCGCRFKNSRWDAFVVCPKCERVYPNEAPEMNKPLTVEERRWMCLYCGELNECYKGASPRTSCANCGADRWKRDEYLKVGEKKKASRKIPLIIFLVSLCIAGLNMFLAYIFGKSDAVMITMFISMLISAGCLIAGAYFVLKNK